VVLCWPEIYAPKSTILILQFEHSHLSKQVFHGFQWYSVGLRVTKQNRQFQDSHLSKQVFQQIPAVLCWPDIYARKSTILILQFEHSHLSKQVFQWITVVLCWPEWPNKIDNSNNLICQSKCFNRFQWYFVGLAVWDRRYKIDDFNTTIWTLSSVKESVSVDSSGTLLAYKSDKTKSTIWILASVEARLWMGSSGTLLASQSSIGTDWKYCN
jgi:hypothetical protein